MPVSADDVRNAYRFILGREPENEEAVATHRRMHADFQALRTSFFSSEEFRNIEFSVKRLPYVPLQIPALTIETAASQEVLRAIVAKAAHLWEDLGRTMPHQSVLWLPEYTPDRIAETEEHFYETGKQDLNLVLALLHRVGSGPERFHRCLEFGCGVGRVTPHLAAVFPEIVALDVSRSHIELAQRRVAAMRRANVSFMQVTPENLHPGAGYDLWFSRLVLQHIPPPVSVSILDKMFEGLLPGGVAIIHTPTYLRGYQFTVAGYLAGNWSEQAEQHAIPQKILLELAWRHGCRLLDIREEPPAQSEWITNIFVFQKRDSG